MQMGFGEDLFLHGSCKQCGVERCRLIDQVYHLDDIRLQLLQIFTQMMDANTAEAERIDGGKLIFGEFQSVQRETVYRFHARLRDRRPEMLAIGFFVHR